MLCRLFSGVVLGAFITGAVVACSISAPQTTKGTGGEANGGSGDATTTGGANSSAGTAVTAGSAAGGATSSAGTGSAVAGTASTAGSAGSDPGISCKADEKECDGKCVSLADPTYGCDKTSCDDSACPSAGSGTLVCEDDSCVLGACGLNTKKCGNKCVPRDRNNGCDDASCDECDSNQDCAGSPSTCTCVPSIKATACAGKCGSVANGCGGNHDCGGCTLPQTCGGSTPGVCGCTAIAKATACSGKACGSASDGCGNSYTCGSCTALANAVASCESNACVNACAAGVMPLTCPNVSPSMPRCGAWSFETSAAEGWIKGDPSDAAVTAKTTIATGAAQKVDGSRSLVITTTIPGGENPSTFDYEQQITLEAPLCPDFSSLNLSNRVFEVHAYFERISGTALTSANAKLTAGSVQETSGGVDSIGSAPFSVAEGVWLSGTSQVSVAATHLTITVAVGPRLATPWNGRIYLDMLALH